MMDGSKCRDRRSAPIGDSNKISEALSSSERVEIEDYGLREKRDFGRARIPKGFSAQAVAFSQEKGERSSSVYFSARSRAMILSLFFALRLMFFIRYEINSMNS
jgi:hypothetical protein